MTDGWPSGVAAKPREKMQGGRGQLLVDMYLHLLAGQGRAGPERNVSSPRRSEAERKHHSPLEKRFSPGQHNHIYGTEPQTLFPLPLTFQLPRNGSLCKPRAPPATPAAAPPWKGRRLPPLPLPPPAPAATIGDGDGDAKNKTKQELFCSCLLCAPLALVATQKVRY